MNDISDIIRESICRKIVEWESYKWGSFADIKHITLANVVQFTLTQMSKKGNIGDIEYTILYQVELVSKKYGYDYFKPSNGEVKSFTISDILVITDKDLIPYMRVSKLNQINI